MKKNTCSNYIKLILKRGGRWRNKQIELEILRHYGLQFQNNTIAKYLSFLMKEGKVLSAPVTKKGTVSFEYWWVESTKKNGRSNGLMTVAEFIAVCRKRADTYPFDHPQLVPIINQYTRLEKIKDKEKTYV